MRANTYTHKYTSYFTASVNNRRITHREDKVKLNTIAKKHRLTYNKSIGVHDQNAPFKYNIS